MVSNNSWFLNTITVKTFIRVLDMFSLQFLRFTLNLGFTTDPLRCDPCTVFAGGLLDLGPACTSRR